MPNLTVPWLDKIQTGVFLISPFLVKSLINQNCPNSRVSNDIDIKLGTESKFENKNLATVKMASCQQFMAPSSLFRFMANLENTESQILDVWSIVITSTLSITFPLTKTGNKTKRPLTQCPYSCFEKRWYFAYFRMPGTINYSFWNFTFLCVYVLSFNILA